MRTLAQQLEAALTPKVVQAAVVEVKRNSLPEQRAFDRAARIGGVGNLDRLRVICDIARNRPTARKVQEAKQAMLEFLQKHTATGSRHLTLEQFVQLDGYYKLSLAGLKASQIGENAAVWVDAAAMYEYVATLPLKPQRIANNH